MQINLLFDDSIKNNEGVDEYIVTFGGFPIYAQRVSFWKETEKEALDEGRRDFASKLREALELVDKFDNLTDNLRGLTRRDY